MTMLRSLCAPLLATLLLAACGGGTAPATDASPLAVHDGWVRVPPPGAPATAGYLVFENRGDAVLSVTGIASDDFGRSELHDMIHEDGMMRMRPIERLDIVPGERVELRPGGKHLMLFEPQAELADGGTVTLRVQFEYEREPAERAVELPLRGR